MFFMKRKDSKKTKDFETRYEYLEHKDFIRRFEMELERFGYLHDLRINYLKDEPNSKTFVIPLISNIPSEYSQSYNQFLLMNEDKVWDIILCDDTMECLHDTLKTKKMVEYHLTLYLTNDCTGFDSSMKQECFGIEVRY